MPFILEEIEKRKKKTRANSSVIPPDRNSTDRSRSGGDELSLLPCKIQGIVSLVCLEIERSRMDGETSRKYEILTDRSFDR